MSCPIARLGYDRDGKKGKLQINYGLLTNERGIPVSVSVFEGNTGDPKTLLPQVEKVQERFGIEQFVMERVAYVHRAYPRIEWATAE